MGIEIEFVKREKRGNSRKVSALRIGADAFRAEKRKEGVTKKTGEKTDTGKKKHPRGRPGEGVAVGAGPGPWGEGRVLRFSHQGEKKGELPLEKSKELYCRLTFDTEKRRGKSLFRQAVPPPRRDKDINCKRGEKKESPLGSQESSSFSLARDSFLRRGKRKRNQADQCPFEGTWHLLGQKTPRH